MRRCPDVKASDPPPAPNRPSLPVLLLAPPPPAHRRLRKALHARGERAREEYTPSLLPLFIFDHSATSWLTEDSRED